MSGHQTISSTDPVIGNIQVQTSSAGLAVPLLWGRPRVGGNALWYGDFKAIPYTESTQSGGKGGGGIVQETHKFAYQAAVVLALGAGPINGVTAAWKGKAYIPGSMTGNRISTLTHSVTVPTGGVVTVPSASNFSAAVSVRDPAYTVPGRPDVLGIAGVGSPSAGVLAEGVDYTRTSATYTFSAAWIGRAVQIDYQTQDTTATQSVLSDLGLDLATGTIGQPVWSHLTTNHVGQDIGYSGLAVLRAAAYPLTASAQIENHNFEVSTPSEFGSGVVDADMSRVVSEFLTDGDRGALWPASMLGDMSQYRAYVVSHGLFMSPALTSQERAADILTRWLKFTNSDCVWSGALLKIVPLGDDGMSRYGVTYTPDTTPRYDLVSTDFLADPGQPRVRIVPRSNEDAYNVIRVEYLARANGYNVDIVEDRDRAHIEAFGERVKDVIQAHEITTPEVAAFVAQMELQRQMAVQNDYQFRLPWTKSRLEALDLLTLTTDDELALVRQPVRITSIEEADEGEHAVMAEDAPIGMASAPAIGVQAGSGYQPDYMAAPGAALAPVIFEAPGQLTVNGLELYIATRGTGAAWGGCHVWVSLDGGNYRKVATINGGSRFGTLSAGCSASGNVAVAINGGQLGTGSAADAAALTTLCYMRAAAGGQDEYFAYQAATLTSGLHYTLSGTVRGAYGSTPAGHAAGAPFVRVDDGLARSGPIDLAYVGRTVRIKLQSFNIVGLKPEDLSTLTEYTYTITGAMVYGNAGAAALAGLAAAASDNVLTAGEKPPVILQRDVIVAEQSGIDAQATAYGITTEKAAYDSAVSALASYLAGLASPVAWNNLSGDTTIVGTVFRAAFAAVYSSRQTLLNRIAQEAGTRASWASITGAGKPASFATVGKSLGLPFESWNLNGHTIVTLTDGRVGSTALRIVGLAGQAPNQGNYTAIDTTKKYRTRFWARPMASTAGQLYFALRQFTDAAGTPGPVNGGFSPYKPGGISRADHNTLFGGTDLWAEYVYTWSAADWQSGVRYVQPVFLDNYSGQAGYWEIQDFSFDEITDVSAAADLAATANTAAGTALTAAGNAQHDATTALGQLADIASDNLLTPDEKPRVMLDRDVLIAEQSGIDSQATTFGITTEKAAYDTALSSLTAYLATLSSPVAWNDLAGNTTIAGSTFRSTFGAAYAARQALLNKISTVAASQAVWSNITGTGKPADGATVNRITASSTAPSGAVDGDVWIDTSGTPRVINNRIGGAWVAGANLSTGALAQLDAVDTGEIVGQAATKSIATNVAVVTTYLYPVFYAAGVNVIDTVVTHSHTNTSSLPIVAQCEVSLTVVLNAGGGYTGGLQWAVQLVTSIDGVVQTVDERGTGNQPIFQQITVDAGKTVNFLLRNYFHTIGAGGQSGPSATITSSNVLQRMTIIKR